MMTLTYLGVYVEAEGAGGCSPWRVRMSWRGWQSPSGDHGDTPAYPEQRCRNQLIGQCDKWRPVIGQYLEPGVRLRAHVTVNLFMSK